VLITTYIPRDMTSIDDLSYIVQSLIDIEIDDLIFDLVYELHSSLKGIPEHELELYNNGGKTKLMLSPPSTVEKQTCIFPHCGQSNIVAIRFAYHLAKCLGVGRRSSRQAKHRIVDHMIMTAATGSSDDSRSNGDDFNNVEPTTSLLEDASSCTDSTSSSMTLLNSNSKDHRRVIEEDQEYKGDFDEEEEDDDDWKPKKKKRRSTTGNANGTNNKTKRKKKKDLLVVVSPASGGSQVIGDLDFHNCIIPLDKLW